ncbi:hypothetical protein CPB84DRAFT_1852624 [Gymnopilus junonius]|uniref:Uncharacterized protein n=1 Tax=Gymnopilus junonius TaxID=109634 RepID=A0A9P5NC72_GYMJU|nr:hypothetical protein CPB84DRAFT_1852624 [Gymnopilus junonius]
MESQAQSKLLHQAVIVQFGEELGALIGRSVGPGQKVLKDLILNHGQVAEIDKFFSSFCWRIFEIDPETNGVLINDPNGYLREDREHDSQAEVARNGLRLSFKAEDKIGLRSSEVLATFAFGNTKPQIEHVLEVSVVAHMINDPKFVEKVTKIYTKYNMKFDPLSLLAELAETLKEKENLVRDIPQEFNLHKAQFFMGHEALSIPLALYLEEGSKFQRHRIEHHANTHENAYVRFIFEELCKTRFAQGNWYQLIGQMWFIKGPKEKVYKGY